LQIVLALAHRPPILLLDEPMDGLDPVVRSRTLSLLAEHLADTPTTILISTHQIHELESLADHVGILRDGRLVAQMSRDKLQRTVGRYRVEVPMGWQATHELQAAGVRSNGVREAQWTLIGDQRELIDRLTLAGAIVREVQPLALADATLAFLSQELTR
jgi:ABC-2 type transport system ATP-binding protein